MLENTTKPRNLSDVLSQILEFVPYDERELRQSIQSIKTSVAYAAPEMMQSWWRQTQIFLQSDVGYPDVEWKIHVAAIFADIPFEKMKQQLATHEGQ